MSTQDQDGYSGTSFSGTPFGGKPFSGKQMTHADAIRLYAAERYVMGELSPAERDSYEDHYFSCVECAQEVTAASRLGEQVRTAGLNIAQPVQVSRNKPRTKGVFLHWLSGPLPAWSVAAMLGFALLRQSPAPDKALTPTALISYNLTHLGSRSAEQIQIIRPVADRPFTLLIAIPPDPSAVSFEVAVVGTDAKEKLRVPIAVDQANDTVQLLADSSILPPGDYQLMVVAVAKNNNKQTIISNRFQIGE